MPFDLTIPEGFHSIHKPFSVGPEWTLDPRTLQEAYKATERYVPDHLRSRIIKKGWGGSLLGDIVGSRRLNVQQLFQTEYGIPFLGLEPHNIHYQHVSEASQFLTQGPEGPHHPLWTEVKERLRILPENLRGWGLAYEIETNIGPGKHYHPPSNQPVTGGLIVFGYRFGGIERFSDIITRGTNSGLHVYVRNHNLLLPALQGPFIRRLEGIGAWFPYLTAPSHTRSVPDHEYRDNVQEYQERYKEGALDRFHGIARFTQTVMDSLKRHTGQKDTPLYAIAQGPQAGFLAQQMAERRLDLGRAVFITPQFLPSPETRLYMPPSMMLFPESVFSPETPSPEAFQAVTLLRRSRHSRNILHLSLRSPRAITRDPSDVKSLFHFLQNSPDLLKIRDRTIFEGEGIKLWADATFRKHRARRHELQDQLRRLDKALPHARRTATLERGAIKK